MPEQQAIGTHGPLDWPYELPVHYEDKPVEVRVELGGEKVARTGRPLLMLEKRHAPMFYVPVSDVRMELLKESGRTYECPRKGHAVYYNVEAGGVSAENAAWRYTTPRSPYPEIEGYVAFDVKLVDAYQDGEKVDPSAGWRA
jgi:uncharacterized protein (DUF427 family)